MIEKPRDEILLAVKNLKKVFSARKASPKIHAVEDLSFDVRRGETFGLVGESGCGKTTAGRTIIRLNKPTQGEIWFDGTEIGRLTEKEFKPFRKRIQMIFQDPYGSLNPRMTIGEIIGEPLDIHGVETKGIRRDRIDEMLRAVGLIENHAGRYPHEFSGGQRQRVGIARALAVNPELVICDEPLSALDLSVQAQVVNMLEDLQEKRGLTYLFIAHDLSMVRHISDRIGVMYMGKLVEQADACELYNHPVHPYTRALLSAIPSINPDRNRGRVALKGEAQESYGSQSGCSFKARCPLAMKICKEEIPAMKDIGGGHLCACHAID
jgi:oligopeptide transport system ATP-binding protein